jgi:UDP-N-acetylglucosamine:LPS N-acetylglucosamine transferase
MATVEKLSVSLGAEEAAWARKQAEASGRSLSAVLTDALRRQRKLEAMDRLLAELGTDDITEEDLAAVRAEWRG